MGKGVSVSFPVITRFQSTCMNSKDTCFPAVIGEDGLSTFHILGSHLTAQRLPWLHGTGA